MLAVHPLVQVAQVDDLSARFLLQTVCIDSADDLRRGVLALLVRSQALDRCSIRYDACVVATRVLVFRGTVAVQA